MATKMTSRSSLNINNKANIKHSIKGTPSNWIEMQLETFVNWININLRSRGMKVKNIEKDFEDGTKLVNLFEVIAKRNIGKYVKKPRFHTQKMENVTLVLKEMEKDGVKAVSIDSDHIVKGNFKMILGLVWQLILRYQVGGSEDDSIKIVVKKLLLIWLQHVVPDQNIKNLTSDWNSGVALCNLIDVLQPGLCPEYSSMRADSSLENVSKGLKLAEEAFGIPQIISPDYMMNPEVDDLSMTTYLSYFTQDGGVGQQWTLNLIRNWNPHIEINNFKTDWNDGRILSNLVNTFQPDSVDEDLLSDDAVENCRIAMDTAREQCDVQHIIRPEEMANPKIPELAIMAYVMQFSKLHESGFFWASGSGLIEAELDKENCFHVNFPSTVNMEYLYVVVLNPTNQTLKITHEDVSQSVRRFIYTPPEPGNYTVNISYEGQHVSRSPYLVHVLPPTSSPTQQEGSPFTSNRSSFASNRSSLYSNSIASPSSLYAEVTERIGISVDTRNSGPGTLTATTTGPDGTTVIDTSVFRDEDGMGTVSFTPKYTGKYDTVVHWNGEPIAQSPFHVYICDPTKCIPRQPVACQGVVRQQCDFHMMTTGAGDGFVTSFAEYIGGNLSVDVTVSEVEEEHFCCSFTPSVAGEYLLHVNYSDCPISGSPFPISVKQRWSVGMVFDGRKEHEAHVQCTFELGVEDLDGVGELKCVVKGPSGEDVECNITEAEECEGKGRFVVSFIPTNEGDHTIEIYYRDVKEDRCSYTLGVISPAPTTVSRPLHACLFAEVDEKIGISVDSRKSGKGMMTADTTGPEESGDIPTDIVVENDGRHTVSFTPTDVGLWEMNIYWNDKLIKGSPFRVCVVDPSKVVLNDPVTVGRVGEDMFFEVVTAGAGPGTLTSHVEYDGVLLEVEITEEEDEECYICSFNPMSAGAYILHMQYNESEMAPCPCAVYDVDNVRLIVEPSAAAERDREYEFHIQMPDAFGEETLKCVIRGPDGDKVDCVLHPDTDSSGARRVSFTPPVEGRYEVAVEYGGMFIQDCPYSIDVTDPPVASEVLTSGEGLCGGYIGEVCRVHVDGKAAGRGNLAVDIEGHKDMSVEVAAIEDDTFDITYRPPTAGTFLLNIKWSDVHVPGSPFHVVAKERIDASKVILSGSGLTEGTVGLPTIFKVDGRNAGPGHLTCMCRAPSGVKTEVVMCRNEDDTHKVDLNVSEPGLHKLYIKWEDENVPDSPFLVKVVQQPDVTRVLCYGPGLESGLLDDFEGIFHVDTTGGGPGALKVRINGPKECFNVEMSRDRLKTRVINVKYNPTMAGVYTANVFWSDQHVNGSPFEVFIAAKKSHLEKWRTLREENEKRDGLNG